MRFDKSIMSANLTSDFASGALLVPVAPKRELLNAPTKDPTLRSFEARTDSAEFGIL